MRKSIKISLIICMAVIAVLGLVVGMTPKNTVSIPAVLNESNNSTVNTTIINTSPSTESTGEGSSMTAEEAMEIVNNELYPYYQATSAVLIDGTPNPVYLVHIIHITPNTYGKEGGNVTVDTITGFVEHKGV
jgi:hypothetical protein